MMRLVALCVLAFVACDPPTKKPPGDGADAPDTNGATDTAPEAADAIGESRDDAAMTDAVLDDLGADIPESSDAHEADTALPDPCDPNPCEAAPGPHCAVYRAALVRYDGPKCAPDGAEAACAYPATLEACAPGELCLDRACTPVASRCDFPIGGELAVTTWIDFGDQSDRVHPDTGEREDACCRDWDGDGFIDNALGDTFRNLAPILGPSADIWEGVVARGPPVLELRGVDDWQDDAYVEVIGYAGSYHRPEEGTVIIGADGFEPGTNLPPVSGWGHIEDGVLRVEDGYLRTVVGPLDAPVVMEYRQLHMEAHLAPDLQRGGFTARGAEGERGAKVSGLIARDAIFDGLNQHGFDFCRCVAFDSGTEPFIDLATGECQPAANRAPSAGCVESDSLCELLEGAFCDFLVSQFQPDIDTNGDGRLDAISVGQWTTTVAVRAREVEDCP